ncbi:hypothetical protein ABW20_dc0109844 [Dactylellina cionopaga]|nr:hypothetical protein ABW20_dc0109844 [Dactylellina cionopaga]
MPMPAPHRTPTPTRTVIRQVPVPVHVHRDCVHRESFEDVIDGVVESQVEGVRQVEDELREERRERKVEMRRSELRDDALRRDIRNLEQRTANLEQDQRETLILAATSPRSPTVVNVQNVCPHRPSSRGSYRGGGDGGSSDPSLPGSGGRQPKGPGPGPGPLQPNSSDYWTPTGTSTYVGGIHGYSSPPLSPPRSPFPPFHPSGPPPPGNLGIHTVFPIDPLDDSVDNVSNESGFRTTSEEPSPRTAHRRASIDYPRPIPPPSHADPIVPPNTRTPPRNMHRRSQTPNRDFPSPQGPPQPRLRRSQFLRRSQPYFPSENSSVLPEIIELDSPLPGEMPGMQVPRFLPGMRRSRENLTQPQRPPFPPFSGENMRKRSRSFDNQMHGINDINIPERDTRRGSRRTSRRMSSPSIEMGDLRTVFNEDEIHGPSRRESVNSVHVHWVPEHEFRQYPDPGFDRSGSSDDYEGGQGQMPPQGWVPPRGPPRGRRGSGIGGRGPQIHRPDGPGDMYNEYNYDPDKVRGTARRTSSTVVEPSPYIDGERERHLRSMGMMGGMETIPSQDTGSEMDMNGGIGRERGGSGGSGESGVGRDGRFRYDRYRDYRGD